MSPTAQNPVRSAWGALQSQTFVGLHLGVRADDTVVQALFAQRNVDGRHHGRQAYRLSELSSHPQTKAAHQAEHDSFQRAFNAAKVSWFRSHQPALSAQQDIITFVEEQETWVKAHIGPNALHAQAAAWFICGYAALFASWSLVSVRMIPIGGVGRRQFAIIAEENIPRGTIMHELTGLLTSEAADGYSHSNLSLMRDLDGVRRVLTGPIRFLNHSCNANTEFRFPKTGDGFAVTVHTNRQIQKDEELTVNYGSQYWTPDNPCLCPTCVPPDAVPAPKTTGSWDVKVQKTRSARRHTQRRANKKLAFSKRQNKPEDVIKPSPLSTNPPPSPSSYQDTALPGVEPQTPASLPHLRRNRKRARCTDRLNRRSCHLISLLLGRQHMSAVRTRKTGVA
ncbi:hypothetical protein C8R47DRAFT_1109051 [Mycena vitilis]|nr:hypothetical protein C8R47DRAFT_1109051 [Mycena vitilis]